MINKITCEYIDDKTNEKTLTHDLSKMTKAKFKSVNRYFAFVEQYTGITEPRNRDIFKKLSQMLFNDMYQILHQNYDY